MIRINLLPHREARRQQRKVAFFVMLGMSAVIGAAIVGAVGGVLAHQISNQQQRNDFIKAENKKLDAQIKEVAMLKQEIEALKARQRAVEDLQSNRNQPVHLMDELVKQMPEGVFLNSFRQSGQRVVLQGMAQSNERVSELLRNLSNNSPWLERPDLVEIRASAMNGKGGRRTYAFTMNVVLKKPRDKKPGANGAPADDLLAPAGAPAAAPASAKNP